MDEQEATDELERLVGSVDGCFRLMRIYEGSLYDRPRHDLLRRDESLVAVRGIFGHRAAAAGYSDAAIQHYLDHIR